MVEVTGEKAEKAVDKFEAAADIGLLKMSVHSPPPFPRAWIRDPRLNLAVWLLKLYLSYSVGHDQAYSFIHHSLVPLESPTSKLHRVS